VTGRPLFGLILFPDFDSAHSAAAPVSDAVNSTLLALKNASRIESASPYGTGSEEL